MTGAKLKPFFGHCVKTMLVSSFWTRLWCGECEILKFLWYHAFMYHLTW